MNEIERLGPKDSQLHVMQAELPSTDGFTAFFTGGVPGLDDLEEIIHLELRELSNKNGQTSDEQDQLEKSRDVMLNIIQALKAEYGTTEEEGAWVAYFTFAGTEVLRVTRQKLRAYKA